MAMCRYDEDEELARAIAASLNEDQPKPKPRTHSTVRTTCQYADLCRNGALDCAIFLYTESWAEEQGQ